MILMKTKQKGKVISFLKRLFPPLRRVMDKLSSARVAGILGLMLSSGFPMEGALEMAPAALTDEDAIAKVNIVNVNGKAKRLGRTAGRTAAYKKAIVTLTENSKTIEFFESL